MHGLIEHKLAIGMVEIIYKKIVYISLLHFLWIVFFCYLYTWFDTHHWTSECNIIKMGIIFY